MIGDSVFQTIRMSMNIGVREIMDAGIKDASAIEGIRSIAIYRSPRIDEIWGKHDDNPILANIKEIFNTKSSILIVMQKKR